MSLRILVVDDSAVVRRVLTDELNTEPAILEVATAVDGAQALQRLTSFPANIIILDLEMPVMDGFGFLRELRRRGVRTPVIVFSTLSERGARATLDALTLGATDYVCKPTALTPSSPKSGVQAIIKDVLMPKIIALSSRAAALGDGPTGESPRPFTPAGLPILRRYVPTQVQLVVIGVSTGGPTALSQVIPALPAGYPVPVVIVQHMPAAFTRMLAARLEARSNMPVREAQHAETLKNGQVYLAPGDHHVTLSSDPHVGHRLHLDQSPPENGCRPSVDPLLRTAARSLGAGVLAVIMTGLGSDGTRGADALVATGGSVWVQDEKSSAVWGMPGSVVRAGLASRILPLEHIAPELIRAVNSAPARTQAATGEPRP
ncbi:MAG: chemotaxis response regulator protein-glutamate methylesterase [Myxococcales bacterium]|nr:chemotaxis response regulator protein-glutamate methylesterase [Myxococcales bacterium]